VEDDPADERRCFIPVDIFRPAVGKSAAEGDLYFGMRPHEAGDIPASSPNGQELAPGEPVVELVSPDRYPILSGPRRILVHVDPIDSRRCPRSDTESGELRSVVVFPAVPSRRRHEYRTGEQVKETSGRGMGLSSGREGLTEVEDFDQRSPEPLRG